MRNQIQIQKSFCKNPHLGYTEKFIIIAKQIIYDLLC